VLNSWVLEPETPQLLSYQIRGPYESRQYQMDINDLGKCPAEVGGPPTNKVLRPVQQVRLHRDVSIAVASSCTCSACCLRLDPPAATCALVWSDARRGPASSVVTATFPQCFERGSLFWVTLVKRLVHIRLRGALNRPWMARARLRGTLDPSSSFPP